MKSLLTYALASLMLIAGCASHAGNGHGNKFGHWFFGKFSETQIGPRPFYLVEDMDEGELKDKLKSCESGPFFQ
ncbi:MAG: hypothetical protein QF808_04550, partial [Thalassolituus sp.]|nr:hypothetical protein [Thalassolituus sp.]